MAILEGVHDFTLLLFVLVFVAFIWMLKLASELKGAIMQKSKALDAKVTNLETKAVGIRREVLDLHRTIGQKLDREEFEKRIDGLVALVGKKKEAEKRKDAR
ncbi:MAG TPA: hypothetical protein VJI13_00170 [Candidatus Norongarragalinales archaeon]|nr:hypothetical protein [Candidatus Norongarragalinales archaeon]